MRNPFPTRPSLLWESVYDDMRCPGGWVMYCIFSLDAQVSRGSSKARHSSLAKEQVTNGSNISYHGMRDDWLFSLICLCWVFFGKSIHHLDYKMSEIMTSAFHKFPAHTDVFK